MAVTSNNANMKAEPTAKAPEPDTKPDTKPDMSSTTTKTPATRKEPPPEKQSDISRRTWVILSFWFVVLCFGLPVWWQTTSIPRADLPIDEMIEWSEGKVCRPVFPLTVAVGAPAITDSDVRSLLNLSQNGLDHLNDFAGHHLQLVRRSRSAEGSATRYDPDSALTINLEAGNQLHSALDPQHPVLDLTYPWETFANDDKAASIAELANYIARELHNVFAEEQAFISYLLATSPSIQPDQRFLSNSYPQFADALSQRMTRSLKYSRTYHLTFSLFTDGPTPSAWNIEAAIDEYMRPVLDMLKPIHNFTIDTQVQLYAAPGVQSQRLSKAELSSFINAAEWPLSPSMGGAPTVNFVLYIGNQTIASDDSPDATTSQSWLIPQWGGVYLLPLSSSISHVQTDQLRAPFLTFTSHLLSLLGTPQSGTLPLRLQTLARVRSADLLLRASSTLGSLARLSKALPSISIPSSVADGVSKSLQHLDLACRSLGSAGSSLEHAQIAEAEAERAFFEKSMVGQLYFPDEHKIAVYLPLLGPVGVPLIMGLLNEIKAWRQRRSQKVKAA